MRIETLSIGFENCDGVDIDGKNIGGFLIDDIHQNICRMASNWIDEMIIADTIAIELHKDANVEHRPFGIKEDSYKSTVFDRIAECADITSIDFDLVEDNDGITTVKKKFSFYPKWVGDSDYVNEAQKTSVNNKGNLCIVICEGKEVTDFFDINEEENR